MSSLRLASGESVALDENGFLANLDDWNEAVAQLLATEEGLELTESHWEIIWLLRDFYNTYTISPAMRVLVKQIKAQLGPEKASSIYLLKLFPESPAKIASKIAGLPKPTNCL
ncbi:TusE/DsrC/DsvC family sulfur relay protein [Halioxenophilus sp. WMMB6]|uniref:TusE/DsrC/DsvC family sulfur relay protein n=1 Tax=Halioxenophilus sp. WMMB6 TaxID=3073815 RepID=UPI00295EB646|nr:TusE/DsrC/DsvC family sulfur relay protein [Halioxenophilus sp. WMMB6]